MTTPRPDASDYLTLVASVRDRESLQLMARVLEGQLTVMQAELAQLQQLHSSVQERIRTLGK
jgi:hypothetical protein